MQVGDRVHSANAERHGHAYRYYVAAYACWHAANSLQNILIAWYVAIVLKSSPTELGLSQLALFGAQFLFLPLGGLLADATSSVRLLRAGYLALGLILGGLILSLGVVPPVYHFLTIVVFAVAIGATTGLITPAGEALVAMVTERAHLSKKIGTMNIVQFCSRLFGIVIGGAAELIGWLVSFSIVAILFLMASVEVKFVGAASGASTRAAQHDDKPDSGAANRSRILKTVIALQFAVGLINIGCYAVALPIIVREQLAGGAREIALVTIAFWSGSIVAGLWLRHVARPRRPARWILAALSIGVGMLWIFGSRADVVELFLITLVWGAVAGAALTISRTIIQYFAPAQYRGRIVSLYQLATLGGAAIGAYGFGLAITFVGPAYSCAIGSVAMLGVIVVAGLQGPFRNCTYLRSA
jgi:MFS family permease